MDGFANSIHWREDELHLGRWKVASVQSIENGGWMVLTTLPGIPYVSSKAYAKKQEAMQAAHRVVLFWIENAKTNQDGPGNS